MSHEVTPCPAIPFATAGAALQDIRHTWDNGGNLANRFDFLTNDTENFSYDFLDRLTGVSGNYTKSYTYNAIGNILTKNGVSYTYGAKPHAVTQVGSASYLYDANGTLLGTIKYTPFAK